MKHPILSPYLFSVVIMLFLIYLIGCSHDQELELNSEISYFKEFQDTTRLRFEDIVEYKEGQVRNILVYDTTLILLNRNKQSRFFFNNFSLARIKLGDGYLGRGKGPNEGIGINACGIVNDRIWAHDITKSMVFQFSLNQALLESSSLKYHTAKIDNTYGRICLIDSLTYWSVMDRSSTKKISIRNLADSDFLEQAGEFNRIPSDVPLAVFKDAYSCLIISRPDGEKVVIAYRYIDAIEIFTTKNLSYMTIRGPDVFPLEYEVGESAFNPFYMVKTEKTRKAFINGVATEKYIYLLYSGSSYNNEYWSYGQEIFVFDWEGNPVNRIFLDRYVSVIGVDQKDSTVYSFDNSTGYLLQAKIE
jgi:hypothetical protein